jgi:hypothetical protein
MPLSLQSLRVTQDARLVGKDQGSCEPGSMPCRRIAAQGYSSNTERSKHYIKLRRKMRHHLPALEENNPSPSHRQ